MAVKILIQSQFKRLFQLVDAFSILILPTLRVTLLRALLLRVASNPLVSNSRGQALSFLCFKIPFWFRICIRAIRAQIPRCQETVLLAYGEIPGSASLKDATTLAEEVQRHGTPRLQDLMHAVSFM
jgi:hypothetical protein